jgi:hypothetical protein
MVEDYMADLKADWDYFEGTFHDRLLTDAKLKRFEADQRDLDAFTEGLKKKPTQSQLPYCR